jgi:hypothetical protein
VRCLCPTDQLLFSCALSPPRFATPIFIRLHAVAVLLHSSRHHWYVTCAHRSHLSFNSSQPNTHGSMELQQRRRQTIILSDYSLRAVEVAAVRDKQVCLTLVVFRWPKFIFSVQALYVAPPRESLSEKAKRIKNPTWWIRCVLFIICVSPPDTASPDTIPLPNTVSSNTEGPIQ